MQSIRTNDRYNQLSYKTTFYQHNEGIQTHHLKLLTFEPFLGSMPLIFIHQFQCFCDNSTSIKTISQFTPKKSPKTFMKYAFRLGMISLCALSIESLFVADKATDLSKLKTVVANQEIVVATIGSDSTVFSDGELQHGFGYDVAKSYANYLGVPLRLQTYENEASVLTALKNGDVDMALSTTKTNDIVFSTNPIACDAQTQSKLQTYGLNSDVGFTFLSVDKGLIDHSASFLCNQEQLSQSQAVAKFYNQNLLKNAYSKQHFKEALANKLPIYKTAFQVGADKYNHDWQVLAAISYQESHLNPNAISRTGVQGLMMLTNDTAKAMGVKNRTDALQSIQGGAKYLESIEKLFMDVPASERLWFVLASYNMGPNAVKGIQKKLKAQGKDANRWSQLYVYLAEHASENGRYVQCMHYVENIRTYLEAIKTMQV